ncbi:MAG: ribosome-associated translation inhibitor RaiA [Spirochaetia bacterium]|nr:ribosome-associated translation inhibitor RaiA [Spirochaetia bacterium]
MDITLTGRHVSLTKALKQYAAKKFEKIEGYFDFKDHGELHIIIEVQKYRHIAEAVLISKFHKFSAKVETKDMYASIDAIEEKLLSQIKKQKDKIQRSEKNNNKDDRINILANMGSTTNARGDKFNEIEEEELQALKPMNTEEASEELLASADQFMLFYNVDFNKVCLLRKRKDGKFGMTISKY